MAEESQQRRQRAFLVVVDESEEMRVALRYAARRARATGGRVDLLYVLEPPEFQHFSAIGDLMKEEQREEAERLLQSLSSDVYDMAMSFPVLHLREGNRREELLKLLAEEPGISILVLGAGTGPEGPGPLVSHLVGKMSGKLSVPITIVPGSLSDTEIDDLA
ncbi:MAG: universal stress protein [Alphaproteobacteria bacterium]|nr:universal stress protein [Alphaproteobacteria bacterium]